MLAVSELTVTEIRDVLTVYSEKGRHLQIRQRPSIGLCFCKGGEIIYTHKGRRIVSDASCAVFLPMGEDYELQGTKTGEFLLINFCGDIAVSEFCVFPIHRIEPYVRDFELMKELFFQRRSRQKQMGLFYGILDRLASEEEGAGDVLAPVLRYLEANYTDPQLSNRSMAAQGGISEVYLRQLFKARFGTSPRQYVLNMRMQKSKQLLEEGGATVSEIATACGFSTVCHFCRSFKAATGETPTDHRRLYRRISL